MKPIIIIPAYNPTNILIDLIKNINNYSNTPIIVIDDGSSNEIVIDSKYNIYKVIKLKYNRGKGYALLKGFNFAYNHGFTHAITLDADFQHDPKFLHKFLDKDKNIMLVLGNRIDRSNMPRMRKISNYLTSKILSFFVKVNIYDSQCGFRRYDLNYFLKYNFSENGYQFESEILFKLKNKNHLIEHVGISTIYNSEKSSINNILDTIKFLNLLFRQIFL